MKTKKNLRVLRVVKFGNIGFFLGGLFGVLLALFFTRNDPANVVINNITFDAAVGIMVGGMTGAWWAICNPHRCGTPTKN